MILRKPYAFLIKYFKLIHTVLVLLMCYLLYRTNIILNFFQEYIKSDHIITGRDFTGEIFNIWMFVLPFAILIILGILLGVMFYKKKPKIYYIYNILIILAVLILYNIGYNMVGVLESQTLETRTLRLIRDLFVILISLQGTGVLLTFIRATGFDIKKFDFGRDLAKLDITEADAEEFEVDVDIETNVVKRELLKNLRLAKYVYVENKFIINGLFLITLSIICFVIYINLTIYNKTYSQGDTFAATEFTMSINDCYLTKQDYRGAQINDNYLLVVELKLRAYHSDITLNTVKTQVKVGNQIYYPSNDYDAQLTDLGTVYRSSKIDTNDFDTYLLVYEIPNDSVNKKIVFNYLDSVESSGKLNPKYIKIKLHPNNLDADEEYITVNMNETVSLNEDVLLASSINLHSLNIEERFKINYRYCHMNVCYDSIEYLNPVLNTNYDKVLLKISGDSFIDEGLNNAEFYDLYTIIKYFGKIKYQVGRKTYYYNSLTSVSPKKAVSISDYYFEVPKAVVGADSASLIIDVRNKVYEYIIK